MSNQKAVIQKVEEIVQLANEKYGINLAPQVLFNIRSIRIVAQAQRRGGMMFLRFNPAVVACDASLTHLLASTVAHEIAHLVCYARPELGSNHNPGWKRVCRQLGGDGQARNTNSNIGAALAKGGSGKRRGYVYMVAGERVVAGPVVHKRIQQGRAGYRTRGMGTIIEATHWVKDLVD